MFRSLLCKYLREDRLLLVFIYDMILHIIFPCRKILFNLLGNYSHGRIQKRKSPVELVFLDLLNEVVYQ